MVDFCCGWYRCISYYFINGKLPGNQGGGSKPGEEFENGMNVKFKQSEIINHTSKIKFYV